PPVRSLPQVRGDERDLARLPGRAGIRVQHAQPADDVCWPSQTGQRKVRTEPPPGHLDAGLGGGGPDPGSQPRQLVVLPLVLQPCPENLRVPSVREGTRASHSQYQRVSSCRGALKALEQLVRMPVSHLREESQGDMPLLWPGPSQAELPGAGLLARLKELGQVLLDRFGQR